MKKITGKVVSLVLALALVVTSFSATFAFAATKTETVVVTPANTTLYLAAGATTTNIDVTSLLSGTAQTYDHQAASVTVVEAARASGSDLVKITNDTTNSKVLFALKSSTASGSEVISVRYTGTFATNRPESVTVSGVANITVNVLAPNALVIGKAGFTTSDGTTSPDAIADYNKNETDTTRTTEYSVYSVAQQSGTIFPVYAAQDVVYAQSGVTSSNYLVTAQPEKFTLVDSTTTAGKAFTIKAGTYTNESFLRIGNIAVKATKGTGAATLSNSATDMVTAVAKVTNSIKLDATHAQIFQWHGATWAANTVTDEKTTSTLKDAITGAIIPSAGAINVSGSDIVMGANTTVNSGSVGKVSGATFTLTANDGYIASVADDVAEFDMVKGNVGKVQAKVVVISGGKTGDIDALTSIEVKASDEKVPTVVGNLSSALVKVGTTTNAAVTAGKVTAAHGAAAITISGDKTTVAGVDIANYLSAALNLNDFKGTIATPANAKNVTITTNGTTDATINGALDIPSIVVNSGTTLHVLSSLRADSISGAGTLEITAGKLYVTSNISGISLKLANAFKVGDTIFAADAYKVYDGAFNTVGYTMDKVSGTTSDTFKVKTVDFANIVLNKTSSKLLVGQKETYTVSSYPAGTKLPDGYTVKFTFDGGDDYFNFTSTDTTATVEAKKLESVFTSLNKGTVKATVYDQYGFQAYGYTPATCDVEIVSKLDSTYKSDTTSNVAVATKYTFKITSLNGKAPTMASGNTKVFTTALTNTIGSDYYFTITAVGKVGESAGIYVNGEARLVVATIKANFKSDTTSNITVKGAYTYAITAAATPTFAVGTPSAFTAAFVSKTGDKYLYKITSVGKVGTAAGIYVNGVKVNVATVG